MIGVFNIDNLLRQELSKISKINYQKELIGGYLKCKTNFLTR